MKEEEYSSTIFENRMLIFLEIEPQSNKYNQIYLNKEEYKEITSHIGVLTGKDGLLDIVKIESSVEEYALPDLQSVN